MKVLGWLGIVGCLLGQASLRADVSPLFVSPPSTNQITGPQVSTGWLASPDTNVTGYYLCWGLTSGQTTNFIDVGNVTNATLGGLSTNVYYYFTVVAYDAAGDQAVPSNEIQYMATNQIVLLPPALTTDLTNQTVLAGSSLSLQVQVTGSAPLTYQWMFNGGVMPGATFDTLSLANVTMAQDGAYQVIVANSAGAVTSSVANVTVLVPPIITMDLANQTVSVGSNVTFQVAVAGTGPFNFQWLFNGTDLASANGNPLFLSGVSQQDAGTYQVVVTGPGGTVKSSAAILSVLAPPSITDNPTNQTVVMGSNVTFAVNVTGTAPLTYQWFFNGTALAGATLNSLDLANVTLAQAGSYQVVVANAFGKVTSAAATLGVIPAASLRIDPEGSGSYKLTFGGVANHNYSIQYSTNLNAGWQVLATATSDSAGILTYIAASGASMGCFRVAGQ